MSIVGSVRKEMSWDFIMDNVTMWRMLVDWDSDSVYRCPEVVKVVDYMLPILTIHTDINESLQLFDGSKEMTRPGGWWERESERAHVPNELNPTGGTGGMVDDDTIWHGWVTVWICRLSGGWYPRGVSGLSMTFTFSNFFGLKNFMEKLNCQLAAAAPLGFFGILIKKNEGKWGELGNGQHYGHLYGHLNG